jgi:hypothetical protein
VISVIGNQSSGIGDQAHSEASRSRFLISDR